MTADREDPNAETVAEDKREPVRRAGTLGLVAIGLIVPSAWMAVRLLAGEPAAPDAPLRVEGVLLGMTPSQVREAFTPPAEGTLRSTPGPEGDLALEWGGRAGDAVARFEFHEGVLVAARVVLSSDDQAARGPEIEVRQGAVVHREPGPDGIRLTLISRDCPTHADEVRALLNR